MQKSRQSYGNNPPGRAVTLTSEASLPRAMNNDQINELLSLMGQQIKENAEHRAETAEHRAETIRRFEESDRRFAQLTEVMINGFLRLEDKLGARIDHVAERVDHLTEEVVELKTDMREVKTNIREIKVQAQETNRRLAGTFEHVGQLTERQDVARLRLTDVEHAQQPTNAELDARLRAVESQLRNAS